MRVRSSPAAQLALEQGRVREVNRRFYQALESLSLDEMDEIWLPSESSRCVHPGWPALIGWTAIRESWEQIFRSLHDIRLVVQQESVHIENGVAWLTCLEHLTTTGASNEETAIICASNVFVRHEGEWRMVLHHSSQVAGLEPVTKTIQ